MNEYIEKLRQENADLKKAVNKLNEENSMLRRKIADAETMINSESWCNPDHLANAVEAILLSKLKG